MVWKVKWNGKNGVGGLSKLYSVRSDGNPRIRNRDVEPIKVPDEGEAT